MPMVDKTQDAELEKGFEVMEDTRAFFEEDRNPLFETDDDALFEEHVHEESEFDYEPEGSFLD